MNPLFNPEISSAALFRTDSDVLLVKSSRRSSFALCPPELAGSEAAEQCLFPHTTRQTSFVSIEGRLAAEINYLELSHNVSIMKPFYIMMYLFWYTLYLLLQILDFFSNNCPITLITNSPFPKQSKKNILIVPSVTLHWLSFDIFIQVSPGAHRGCNFSKTECVGNWRDYFFSYQIVIKLADVVTGVPGQCVLTRQSVPLLQEGPL